MRRVCFISIVLLVLWVFGLFEATRVVACSYASDATIEGYIDDGYQIVKARPIEVDDLHQNGTLHVEQYVTGGRGSEYILLLQNDPSTTAGLLQGFFGGGDCSSLKANLSTTQSQYFILRHIDYGYYLAPSRSSRYLFSASEATVQVPTEDTTNPDRAIFLEMTEEEFVEYIANYSGENASLPVEGSSYPLKATLEMTTSTGSAYWLPVDGAAPIEIDTARRHDILYGTYAAMVQQFSSVDRCFTPNCRQFSADGLNLAVQSDENTITIAGSGQISGQAFLFSRTGDSIAIWNGGSLVLYPLWYPRLGWDRSEQQNQTNLAGNAEILRSLAGQAAWTPDGRLLAYSDAEGLWLWDVFSNDLPPRLLLPSADMTIPVARYFSPMGRYLAVREGEQSFTLDIITGEQHPDGMVSPDERILLAFDTNAEFFHVNVCLLISEQCNDINSPMLPVIIESVSTTEPVPFALSEIRQVEWRDAYSFLIYGCNAEDLTLCGTAIVRTSSGGGYWTENAVDSIDYDYDPLNNTLAILLDDTTVLIDGQRYELSGYVDGDIVSIRWGESLFFHE